MRKEVSAGAVIFYEEGKEREYLLLNYRSKTRHWDFPRGHVEINEDPIKAALREIKEETGLRVKIIKGFKESFFFHFKDKGEIVIKEAIYFLAKSKTKKVMLSSEHNGYVWLPFKMALNLITFEEPREILKKAEKFLQKLRNEKRLHIT
jgi:8-oxo-dGTP pyrophosphatase MutT (NUDIX family)